MISISSTYRLKHDVELSFDLYSLVFYATFNSISVISRKQLTSLFMSFLGFTSTRLGSEVSWTLPRKSLEDTVQLEPRAPGLRVKHFISEAGRTLNYPLNSRRIKTKQQQKKGTKSVGSCQPARNVQADMNRYFLQMYAPFFYRAIPRRLT